MKNIYLLWLLLVVEGRVNIFMNGFMIFKVRYVDFEILNIRLYMFYKVVYNWLNVLEFIVLLEDKLN